MKRENRKEKKKEKKGETLKFDTLNNEMNEWMNG